MSFLTVSVTDSYDLDSPVDDTEEVVFVFCDWLIFIAELVVEAEIVGSVANTAFETHEGLLVLVEDLCVLLAEVTLELLVEQDALIVKKDWLWV